MSASDGQMLKEFTDLPPEAQRQVRDYIAFLHRRHAESRAESTPTYQDIQDEPFVGMWREREDMADSAQWVRGLRNRE